MTELINNLASLQRRRIFWECQRMDSLRSADVWEATTGNTSALRRLRDGELVISSLYKGLPSPQEKSEKFPSPIFPEEREGESIHRLIISCQIEPKVVYLKFIFTFLLGLADYLLGMSSLINLLTHYFIFLAIHHSVSFTPSLLPS